LFCFIRHPLIMAPTGAQRQALLTERLLLKTLYGAKHNNDRLRHFIYYIDRHIELDGDSHGPKGRELLEDLLANAPHRDARAWRAACSSIEARIGLWNGTLSNLRSSRRVDSSVEREPVDDRYAGTTIGGTTELVRRVWSALPTAS
jgi:hypothetical protein